MVKLSSVFLLFFIQFDRQSSIRYSSRRARTLESLASLYEVSEKHREKKPFCRPPSSNILSRRLNQFPVFNLQTGRRSCIDCGRECIATTKIWKVHRCRHRERRLWHNIQKGNRSIGCIESRTSMGSGQLDLLNTMILKRKKDRLFVGLDFKHKFTDKMEGERW